jgi:hypothetical protein
VICVADPEPFLPLDLGSVPEFIDPRFRENKPKTLVFSHRKRAVWACFRENWVYNFGHWAESVETVFWVKNTSMLIESF